eukprot:NODE_202_length_13094_cov_1.571528.p9 type:complete len:216 gc:universal NODE_202_length_13094_cov_1.571528:2770-2123(-)
MLSQAGATALDVRLLESFKIEQLIEIAGQACAIAISKEFKPQKTVVLAGSGNNGNDAIVCARYLKTFGFDVEVAIAKPKSQLLESLTGFEIAIWRESEKIYNALNRCELIIDGLLGFGTKGTPRPPYSDLIEYLANSAKNVVSIDIPSGWDVEKGDVYKTEFLPKMVVSLSAPKKCIQYFDGIHYVGGRFLSSAMMKEFQIDVQYDGAELVKKLN